MPFNIETQKDLISRIETQISNLADYLYPDKDKYVDRCFDNIEMLIKSLKDTFHDENTYIKLVERETGEVLMKYFDKGDVDSLCYSAAQFYAWSDCDDTYSLEEIKCDGVALYYCGWQPNMLYEFVTKEGELVYSAEHLQWEH